MHQVEVHLFEAEVLEALLAALDGVLEASGMGGSELGHDEQVFPGEGGFTNRFADLGLVAVGHRRVDHPVALLERVQHGGLALAGLAHQVDP